MSEKKKKQVAMLEKWVPYFIIACTGMGALIGSGIIYYLQGEVPYEVVAGFIAVAVIMTIFQMLKSRLKKGNLPEVDERVAKNVSKLFAYSSHITLGLVILGVAVVTAFGNEVISVSYLWLLFFLYIWIVGIGTFILKRR